MHKVCISLNFRHNWSSQNPHGRYGKWPVTFGFKTVANVDPPQSSPTSDPLDSSGRLYIAGTLNSLMLGKDRAGRDENVDIRWHRQQVPATRLSALCTEADTSLAANGLLSLALTILQGTRKINPEISPSQAQIPPKTTIAGGIGDNLTARTCQVILKLSVFDSCLFTWKQQSYDWGKWLLPQTALCHHRRCSSSCFSPRPVDQNQQDKLPVTDSLLFSSTPASKPPQLSHWGTPHSLDTIIEALIGIKEGKTIPGGSAG